MSNIDKQALRTAAENATPGEWCTDDYHGVIADAGLNANYYIASCSGPDNRHNKRFIAAANPATVLALLDELEVATDACNGWQRKFAEADERLQAAEKRIAELTEKPIGWTDEQELRDVEKLGCGYLFNANPITPHADPRRVILLYAAAAGKGEAS